MGKETGLPKNIRQIGDIHGQEKIYLEDYVMTYIRKKEPQEQQGYLGIFLGERREEEGTVFVFIRGILEVPQEQQQEEQQGKQERSPKERIQRKMAEYFPGWEVQGCCVIGKYPPKQLEQLTEWIPDAGRLIYHLQEQEETLYWKAKGEYRRIRGYFVFYEQNRRMQEYLAEVFSDKTVEKESLPEQAVKSFREKIREKGEKKTGSILKLASSFFAVTVLIIGAIVVNRIDQIRDVQNAAGDMIQIPQAPGEGGTLETQEENTDAVRSVSGTANETESVTETEDDAWMTGSDAFWEDVSAELSELSEQADSTAAQTENSAAQPGTEVQSGDAAQQADGPVQQEGEPVAQETSDTAQETALPETQTENREEEPAQEAAVRSTQAAYVIKEGDTLAGICQKYYGNLDRMAEICEANSISDANMIMPGQKIVLP